MLGTNPEGMTVQVREAQINFSDLVTVGLNALIGTHGFSFDARGNGQSLFFCPDNTSEFASDLFEFLGGGLNQVNGGFDELRPAGVVFTYAKDDWSARVVLLPAAIEQGASKVDEASYGVDFWYNLKSLGQGSRLGFIAMLTNPLGYQVPTYSGAESNVYTIGCAASLMDLLLKQMEIFFEIYFQTGQVGSLGGQDIDLQSMAFEIGFKHVFESDLKPWVEAKVTYVSGDQDQTAGDTDVDSFLSYEYHDDLVILQSQLFGIDWDANFVAFVFKGGVTLSVGSGKDNLALAAAVGIFRANEDVTLPDGPEDALGNEVDVRVTYSASRQVTIDAGIAMLFGSEVLEGLGGGSNDPDADDSSFLFHWGVMGRF
jgi:hypothetical protein